jgi:hypothetical protein
MKNIVFISFIILLFTACSSTVANKTSSATILIKTPSAKFYDKGFIYEFTDYTQVQVFSAGTVVLNLMIYEDRVCKSTFECEDLAVFNSEFLHESYEKSFLKELFTKKEKNIVHRDRKNGILIKIQRD